MIQEPQPGYRIFPIKSETACLLKWSWSTVNLGTGTTSSCHRSYHGEIDPENFKNFHNTPSKIEARQSMIEGRWPDAPYASTNCNYCKKVEAAGGKSDRLMQLELSHLPNKIPPELFENPNAVEVTPTILEVYFNNTCNFSCVYCGPRLSSKWNDEIRRHGTIKISSRIEHYLDHHENNPHYDRMVHELWEYLNENDRYKIIKHFHILGGEPLLQKELDATLDFWANHPNPDLTINLITNLGIPHDKFVEKINKFEELYKTSSIFQLQLTASLDCWGKEQEYVRYGINLESWEQNFKYLLDKEWIFLSINSCVTALTIKTLPDLLEKIQEWNKGRPEGQPIHWNFNLAIGGVPHYTGQHPDVLGYEFFKNDLDKVLSLMSEELEFERANKEHMKGVIDSLRPFSPNKEKIGYLKEYLTELDRRRGTDWISIFPWLNEL